MSSCAPIVLFAYNRLKNTLETIDCLLKNGEAGSSDLFVFSDAPKNEKSTESVSAVREYLHSVTGFKSIHIVERTSNFGLVNNITLGVTEVVNRYGRVIVLEDDHSVSPFFLKYMNEALDLFENREDIACIHGYVYPHQGDLPEAFLIKGADCWGWATWKRAWDLLDMDAGRLYAEIVRQGRQKEFEFNGSYPYMQMLKDQVDGKARSWAICWYASAFLLNKYTVYPDKSLVSLNSLCDEGEHNSPSHGMMRYAVSLGSHPVNWDKASLQDESLKGRREFELFFRSLKSKKEQLASLLLDSEAIAVVKKICNFVKVNKK